MSLWDDPRVEMGTRKGRMGGWSPSASPAATILAAGLPEGWLLVATASLDPLEVRDPGEGGTTVRVAERFVLEVDSDDPLFARINEAFDRDGSVEVPGHGICRPWDIAITMRERAEYMKEVAARGGRLDAMHPSIWDEIRAERAQQDIEWGGPQHDDLHTPLEFLALVVRHVGTLAGLVGNMRHESDIPQIRRRLVVVAALAVAFIETLDRAKHRV